MAALNFAFAMGFAASVVFAMPPASSVLDSERRSAGIDFNNDAHYFTLGLLADEDRYYSQGLRLFWNGAPQSPSSALPPIHQLSLALQADFVSTHLRVGQEVFTPNDIRAVPPLVSDDRPFVGWLHADVGQRFYFPCLQRPARLHLQISLGAIGPASLADITQTEFHRMRRQTSSHPERDPDPSAGWAAQYGSDGFPLILQGYLSQAISFCQARNQHRIGFDFGGEGLLDVGNLYGETGLAVQARAGRLMRSLFRPSHASTPNDWETFIWIRSEIRAVGWNDVLTGAESRDVKPAPWLWQNECGAAWHGPSPFPEISLRLSMWSRETRSQPSQPFQPDHTDYRPTLQKRTPWFDHGFGTLRVAWLWSSF